MWRPPDMSLSLLLMLTLYCSRKWSEMTKNHYSGTPMSCSKRRQQVPKCCSSLQILTHGLNHRKSRFWSHCRPCLPSYQSAGFVCGCCGELTAGRVVTKHGSSINQLVAAIAENQLDQFKNNLDLHRKPTIDCYTQYQIARTLPGRIAGDITHSSSSWRPQIRSQHHPMSDHQLHQFHNLGRFLRQQV